MGAGPSKESVWQYFVNKSANNLHIVLGMSPVGDTLRTRCRNFPGELCVWADFTSFTFFVLSIVLCECTFFSGLMNNTVIDWFLPWPPQALYAVAESFLGGLLQKKKKRKFQKFVLLKNAEILDFL